MSRFDLLVLAVAVIAIEPLIERWFHRWLVQFHRWWCAKRYQARCRAAWGTIEALKGLEERRKAELR